MKKILIFLFLTSSFSLFSQNISVKSFKAIPNDLTARVTAPVTDQNGDKCALIKIRTTQKGFVFEGDMLGITETIEKVAEIWMYVPAKAKRLTIKHPQLGILDNYLYTETIQEATVYVLELTTARVATVVEEIEIPTQWVIITSEPIGANVYLNEEYKGITPFQMELEENDYAYQIELPMYHSEAGKFNLLVSEGKKRINAKLRPNFGYANITTTPENGATISVNGQALTQSSPVKTNRLKSGTYKITAKKNMYHETTKQIIISDGQTSQEEIVLKPSFGNFKITTIPEDNATVLLDGNSTNKTTPCTLEKIISGTHTVTVNKKWYRPVTKQFTVIDGQTENLEIKMPVTFGTINITAGDNADIYIDNKFKANSNWKGRLIEGWHTFEAKKEKYHSDKQKIEIFVSKEQQLSLYPTKMRGKLKIISIPFDAKIKINGEDYGTTPNTIKDLLIGDYTLTLEKASYGTITKSITINEGETTQINETLPAGNGTVKEKIINIVQNGKKGSKYNVEINNESFTDKRDGKIYKWVKIGDQVWMAENLAYKQSSGCWAYDNKQSNVDIYGYLYNWEAAKKVCPVGWHLPSDAEWTQLTDYIAADGHLGTEGTTIKSVSGWDESGNGDYYGFSALPGGSRNYGDGSFSNVGNYGFWWSSTESSSRFFYARRLHNNHCTMKRYHSSKLYGFSVRCIRDN